MGDIVGLHNTAPKISAISYLFGSFSLNNGRHRMTALYPLPQSNSPGYNSTAV